MSKHIRHRWHSVQIKNEDNGYGTIISEDDVHGQMIRLCMKIRVLTCKLMPESTTTGDFPPSSRRTGVRCFAAAAITIRPTLPLPAHSRIT